MVGMDKALKINIINIEGEKKKEDWIPQSCLVK